MVFHVSRLKNVRERSRSRRLLIIELRRRRTIIRDDHWLAAFVVWKRKVFLFIRVFRIKQLYGFYFLYTRPHATTTHIRRNTNRYTTKRSKTFSRTFRSRYSTGKTFLERPRDNFGRRGHAPPSNQSIVINTFTTRPRRVYSATNSRLKVNVTGAKIGEYFI